MHFANRLSGAMALVVSVYGGPLGPRGLETRDLVTTATPHHIVVRAPDFTEVDAANFAGPPKDNLGATILGTRDAASTDAHRRRLAAEKWTSVQECSPEYFRYFDEQNAKSANYGDSYRQWKESRKGQNDGQQRSNYENFALDHTASLNFDCKAELSNGCNQHIKCDDIVRTTRDRNPGMSLEEVMEESRKVYFVTLAMMLQNQEIHSIMDSYNRVENSVLLSMDSLVQSFAQQIDKNGDKICQVAKQSIDMVVGLLATVLGFSPFGKDLPNQAGSFKFVVQVITLITDNALAAEKSSVSGNRQAVDGIKIHLTPTYASGFCAGLGAGRTNDNARHAINLKEHTKRIFKDYRKILFAISNVMAFEDRFDEWIERPFWAQSSQVLNRQKHEFEQQAEVVYTGWALSSIMNGSQCYVKCRTESSFNEDQCRGDGAGQARICPSIHEMCQAACWTTIAKRNHEVEVYGLKNLEKYNYTIEQVMELSRQNFLNRGNTWEPPSLGKDLTFGSESAISVATCRSSRVNITDFSPRKFWGITIPNFLNTSPRKTAFPCTCGNWAGNETSAFLDKLGLKSEPGNPVTKWQKELFSKNCPQQFERRGMHPAPRYLHLCETGTRWPTDRDFLPKLVVGERDPLCASVQKKLQGMSEFEANVFFCNEMPERILIFRDEKDYIDDFAPFPVSHKKMCRKWKRNTDFFRSEARKFLSEARKQPRPPRSE